MLPVIRDDLRLATARCRREQRPLDVPLLALTAPHDGIAPVHAMSQWANYAPSGSRCGPWRATTSSSAPRILRGAATRLLPGRTAVL
ncbi:hypothetical protein ABZ770_36045 [Streptomyces sp. NPDC006654]|uniref:hypothetical protein n=1 Tax=Streptomyces sp. NPDC006654 TaxID=3156897 RepID=UPI003406FE01